MSTLIDNNEHVPSRRSELFFWIIAAAALLLFAGRNALSVNESSWAETLREMLIGQISWGAPCNWKLSPTGSAPGYWFVFPLVKFFGLSELTMRLPSAAAGLLMLFCTKDLSRRLFNVTVSRLAGWLMLGCYGFLFWGRCAASDMLCAAFSSLALTCFFIREENSGFFLSLFFFLFCFLCAFTGGVAAFFLPGMMVFPYLIFTAKWRPLLNYRTLGAFCFALLLSAVPVYLTLTAEIPPQFTPADKSLWMVFQQDISRSLSSFYAIKPLGEFLLTLPRLLLPWTPFFLLGVYGMYRCWKTLSEQQKGIFAGLLLALIFSALTGRHQWGAVLPLFPFAILITAGGMLHGWTPFSWEKGVMKACCYAVSIVASLAVSAVIALPVWGKVLYAKIPLFFLIALPLCGLAVLAVMVLDGLSKPVLSTFTGMPRKFAAPLLGATLLMIAVWSLLLPSLTDFRSTKPFCLALKKELVGIPADAMFFWQDRVSSDLLFYLDRTEPMLEDPAETPETSRQLLKELIAANSGKKIVIFSKIRHCRKSRTGQIERMNEKHLDELEDALHQFGFTAVSGLKPDYIEPLPPFKKESSPRLAVWVLNIPKTTEGKIK